jgi:N-acetylneuraminic acid mutarotase
MKKMFTVVLILGFFPMLFAQQLPDLPIPIGAGNAEVWNGSIYHFGGSDDWSGSIVYPRVYRFDGTSWAYYDSIPDDNVWDVETVLVGNNVYLLGGWRFGPSLNRRYDLVSHSWAYLATSPNLTQTWGITSEQLDGIIYLFNSSGEVFAYNIASDTWTTKTSNTAVGSWDMSSILHQNEIYIIGWDDSAFYKYTPSTDQWTRLANSPYQVGACAFGVMNNLIYCVGGNSGGTTGAAYKSIIVYDIVTNTWSLDNHEISSKRHWMATAEYNGGLYVVGGLDEFAQAVDTVEEIVPQGTSGIHNFPADPKGYFLGQNYPNPYTQNTTISFSIPEQSHITISLYDILGNKVATLVDSEKSAGDYRIQVNAGQLHEGVYYYTLLSGSVVLTKKMLLQE